MTQPPSGFYQPVVVGGSGANDIGPGGAAASFAFHAGGVAACDGCHVMHNATSGVAKSTTGLSGEPAWNSFTNAYLLQGGDQSSTCLICHGSATAKTATSQQFIIADLSGGTPSFRTPGGDFGWLSQSFAAFGGATGGIASPGEAHGHNVAALDFGWQVDSGRFTAGVAPGGSFAFDGVSATEKFACSSCHDPHGRYRMQLGAGGTNGVVFAGPYAGSPATQPIAASGSYGAEPTATYAVGVYRLLAGQRYAPASKPGFPFPNNPPIAVAPPTYNQSEATTEVRVNYATGMSEWCQNCHASIHLNSYSSGWSGLRHPAGSEATLHAGQFNLYNTYKGSGSIDPTLTSNYTSLVPFEQGTSITLATLRNQAQAGTSIIAGPTNNVMCLSCHRAHASAFDSMVRWDQNATFLTDGTGFTSGVTDRAATVTAAGYYDRGVVVGGSTDGTDLGTYQRSLCNKCHGKD